MARPSVLIVGVSVRAFAESAVRAGYDVTAVDGYADLDTARAARVRRISPYTAEAAARAARDMPETIVAYTSNFENHPAALRQLTRGRTLWGNTVRTLALARAPIAMTAALQAQGVPMPRIRARAPRAGSAEARQPWLLKPRASGGGHGIARWATSMTVSRRHVLQERIAGMPGSILFVADGRACRPFATTCQLVGDRRFGADRYRYCGTILTPPDDPAWGAQSPAADSASRLASTATRAFGLVGVNGIDVISARGGVFPIEINPRFTAAMELVERRDGLSVFGAHVAGCTGRLDTVVLPREKPVAVGKAIVFARRISTIADVRHWLDDPDIGDIPCSGVRIPRGAPICTVFAAAPTARECYEQLGARASRVFDEVQS